MGRGSLATVLSVIAIAGLGFVYVKVDRLAARIDSGRAVTPPRDGPTGKRDAPPVSAPDAAVAEAARAKTAPDEPVAPAPDDVDLAERLKKLEARVDKQPFGWRRVGDMEQLARRLKLTATQRDRVKAVVDHGRRRIEEILKIPDASGTSPFERRQSLFRRTREALRTGDWSGILEEVKQPGARDATIPGRSTTYGEEVARIVAETRIEIAGNLSPEQEANFGGAVIDPLVGAGLDPTRIVAAAKRAGPLPESDDGG